MKKLIYDFLKEILPESVQSTLRRIIYAHRNKNFQPYLTEKKVEGISFKFWIGDIEGRDWYDSQATGLDWIEMRFIRDHLIKSGDIVLECGAHHGLGTILFSNWVGAKGKVVAFEPLPQNCNIITKNIELNKLKNIQLENKAIGEMNGRIKINPVSDSYIIRSGKGIEVELIPLDDFAHLNPGFLKIDVEGFELQVLKGAEKILRERPRIAIEIHTEMLSRYKTSVNEILKILNLDHYEVWIQWDDRKEPEEYDFEKPITKRVHLFCIPKQ